MDNELDKTRGLENCGGVCVCVQGNYQSYVNIFVHMYLQGIYMYIDAYSYQLVCMC